MALPFQANTTCDIYRTGNTPPAAPDVAGISCFLRPDWRGGQEAGDRETTSGGVPWTHVMLVETSVDIRDLYQGASITLLQDTVYVPDKNGTPFKVAFVERVHRGQSQDHKRVYLDRQAPNWPTNEL